MSDDLRHGDTIQEEEITCPFCGHQHRDSWEYGYGQDSGETDCEECGKSFEWERVVDISYSTTAPKESETPKQ